MTAQKREDGPRKKPLVIHIRIDPGEAPPEELAEVLSDISMLYRKIGGSGINFTFEGISLLAGEEE